MFKKDSSSAPVYWIYDEGKRIKTLTDADMKAVNDGSMKVPQMKVYDNQKYTFLHGEKLDFTWIEKNGDNFEIIADDLYELAVKNNMDNHEVPEDVDTQLKELMGQREPLLENIHKQMDNFKQI